LQADERGKEWVKKEKERRKALARVGKIALERSRRRVEELHKVFASNR
jgi:hypothetical protein